MSYHGYDPGDRNNWYQSPHLGPFPVSPAAYGGGISGGYYSSPYHSNGSSTCEFTQFSSQPNPYPPLQLNPSATIINGHLLPHQFPCVPQTHSQFFPPPYLQPIHPISPQPLTTTPQSPSIPTYHSPHPNPNLWIHPSISQSHSHEPSIPSVYSQFVPTKTMTTQPIYHSAPPPSAYEQPRLISDLKQVEPALQLRPISMEPDQIHKDQLEARISKTPNSFEAIRSQQSTFQPEILEELRQMRLGPKNPVTKADSNLLKLGSLPATTVATSLTASGKTSSSATATAGGSIRISERPNCNLSHHEVILDLNNDISAVVVSGSSSEDNVAIGLNDKLNVVSNSMGFSAGSRESGIQSTEGAIVTVKLIGPPKEEQVGNEGLDKAVVPISGCGLSSDFVKSSKLDFVSATILQSLREGDGECLDLDGGTYCQVVKEFLDNGNVKELATLIIEAQKLESSIIVVDRSVGYGIVTACVGIGLSDKAHIILDEINAQGGTLGLDVHVPILKAYCKEHRTAEATQLVMDISNSGLKLDMETYETLIGASMSSQDFQLAFDGVLCDVTKLYNHSSLNCKVGEENSSSDDRIEKMNGDVSNLFDKRSTREIELDSFLVARRLAYDTNSIDMEPLGTFEMFNMGLNKKHIITSLSLMGILPPMVFVMEADEKNHLPISPWLICCLLLCDCRKKVLTLAGEGKLNEMVAMFNWFLCAISKVGTLATLNARLNGNFQFLPLENKLLHMNLLLADKLEKMDKIVKMMFVDNWERWKYLVIAANKNGTEDLHANFLENHMELFAKSLRYVMSTLDALYTMQKLGFKFYFQNLYQLLSSLSKLEGDLEDLDRVRNINWEIMTKFSVNPQLSNSIKALEIDCLIALKLVPLLPFKPLQLQCLAAVEDKLKQGGISDTIGGDLELLVLLLFSGVVSSIISNSSYGNSLSYICYLVGNLSHKCQAIQLQNQRQKRNSAMGEEFISDIFCMQLAGLGSLILNKASAFLLLRVTQIVQTNRAANSGLEVCTAFLEKGGVENVHRWDWYKLQIAAKAIVGVDYFLQAATLKELNHVVDPKDMVASEATTQGHMLHDKVINFFSQLNQANARTPLSNYGNGDIKRLVQETNDKCAALAIIPMKNADLVLEANEQPLLPNVIFQVIDFSTYSDNICDFLFHDATIVGMLKTSAAAWLHLAPCLLTNGDSNPIVITWLAKLKAQSPSSSKDSASLGNLSTSTIESLSQIGFEECEWVVVKSVKNCYDDKPGEGAQFTRGLRSSLFFERVAMLRLYLCTWAIIVVWAYLGFSLHESTTSSLSLLK